MLGYLPGALLRALFVVVLIATPSLLLPGVARDTTQIVTLVALFAGGFTIVEYGSTYPSLVEFRFAAPFNRMRFMTLFVTVFHLTLIYRGDQDSNTLTHVLRMIGTLFAHVTDSPASPVAMMTGALGRGLAPDEIATLNAAAGIAALGALIMLAAFIIILRFCDWPRQSGTFNVWINLPLFDPTSARDVVGRLNRDAAINVVMGVALPFMIPLFFNLSNDVVSPTGMTAQPMIWMLTLWTFLPASLLMRGIAMRRVASMIVSKRRERMLESQSNFLPA